MLKVFRQRNFFLLWVGQFVSIIGDWVLFIALPFYIYNLTGSVLATGAMFILSTLPRLLLGSVAGVFVDRWDRKRTMIAADILRFGLVLLMLFVRSKDWLWLIYVSACLEAVVSQFFNPARSAILPLVVSQEDLVTANSLNGFSDALTRLVGAGLGGALMGWLGFSSVAIFDAVSFLFSAVMIFLVVMPAVAPTESPVEKSSPKEKFLGVWREWLAGMQLVKARRLLLGLFLVISVSALGDSMITVLLVPFVKVLMGGGAQFLGWLMMAQGIGGIAGGLLIGQYGKRFSSRGLLAGGFLLIGLIIILMVKIHPAGLVLVLMGGAGVASAAAIISSQTMLQQGVSDEFRGRIFGTLGTTSALASLMGMFLATSLTDLIGLATILLISGIIYSLSGVLTWMMVPRDVPGTDQPAVRPIRSESSS